MAILLKQELTKLFKSKLFVGVLLLKVILAFTTASHYLSGGFAPFVSYFVESGFKNPYQYFLDLGQYRVFPYASMMLYVLALPRLLAAPFLSADPLTVTVIHLALMRLPLLFADFGILLVLRHWLRLHEKEVLWYYWCSPILIYITYYHGQLDVIPTALFILAIGLLFRKYLLPAYVVFGLALACKGNVLTVFPFVAVYLYRKYRHWQEPLRFVAAACLTYTLVNLPFLGSPGFNQLVLRAAEQRLVFQAQLPLGSEGLALFLAPTFIILAFLKFLTYPKVNRELFLMYLSMVFMGLIALIPPRPGWYYWSVPLVAYFFINYRQAPRAGFWLLNGFYLSYFLTYRHSDLWESLSLVWPAAGVWPAPWPWLAAQGINPEFVSNLAFTCLEATLVVCALWIYQRAIQTSLEYRLQDRPTLVGIGGDSGSGKSVLADLLVDLFGSSHTQVLNGDDLHKWERNNQQWDVFTHLDPRSNRLHTDYQHAVALQHGQSIMRVHYDHQTGRFSDPTLMNSSQFLIFAGLHPFVIPKLRNLYDLKIFLEPEKNLQLSWKLIRDQQERGHDPQAVLASVAKRSGDSRQYIAPQKNYADLIIRFETEPVLAAPIQSLTGMRLRLAVRATHDIDWDPLLDAIANESAVVAQPLAEDSIDHSHWLLQGDISRSEIDKVLWRCIPNYHDLLTDLPSWKANSSGLLQLLVLYALSEKLKQGRVVPAH